MTAKTHLSGDRDRLLRHLGEPGCFGVVSPLGCGRVALYRDAGGTRLGAGYAAAEAAAMLVAEGRARWVGTGRSARLLGLAEPVPKRALATKTIVLGDKIETVVVDERESPLLWLHRRNGKDGKPQISASEFAAGERFRTDLTLAQMMPRTTMNWDASLTGDRRGSGGRDPAQASDSALAAHQRVRLACDRMGSELSGLAIDVCGFLKGLDQVERERGWPARSAKIVLRLALSALALHYGIDAPAPPRRRNAVWRGEGARPAIMPASSAGV
ncbi:DUF6456 domain-containing protein [Bosea sp. PAMC 26642]|uniref:DUF6456 domain-containing protein n=1 Tax=Bosea sp. (strain PAMC 26642) TaxID=1792307 RepID=UPI000770578F|nr:DUF6456 domain-containing protein [Bosea sp. PAMC 26642]AMJ59049.1 hypothetical protein AXW83_00935 [Bosea sp. PAMC 26642]